MSHVAHTHYTVPLRPVTRTCLVLKTLGNGVPVDNVPNGAKVLSLAVLVLKVVGVLPSVDTEKRLEVASNRVLVRAGDEAKGTGCLVLDEPGPAGALDTGEGSVGLLLEGLEGAKVLVDGSLETLANITWGYTIHIPEACPRAHHHRPCR
jgi:hypothetical protein